MKELPWPHMQRKVIKATKVHTAEATRRAVAATASVPASVPPGPVPWPGHVVDPAWLTTYQKEHPEAAPVKIPPWEDVVYKPVSEMLKRWFGPGQVVNEKGMPPGDCPQGRGSLQGTAPLPTVNYGDNAIRTGLIHFMETLAEVAENICNRKHDVLSIIGENVAPKGAPPEYDIDPDLLERLLRDPLIDFLEKCREGADDAVDDAQLVVDDTALIRSVWEQIRDGDTASDVDLTEILLELDDIALIEECRRRGITDKDLE